MSDCENERGGAEVDFECDFSVIAHHRRFGWSVPLFWPHTRELAGGCPTPCGQHCVVESPPTSFLQSAARPHPRLVGYTAATLYMRTSGSRRCNIIPGLLISRGGQHCRSLSSSCPLSRTTLARLGPLARLHLHMRPGSGQFARDS